MFFLNLSFGEFAALLGAVSGLVTALYLLDRAKRQKVVSTLRFWVDAPRVEEQRRRKRIREPWSLLLQLLSLLLLLLAIGQLQWGSRVAAARNHIVLLDTSSWMAEANGSGVLLDRAKEEARRYVRSLPARDRVMLVRADSLATPVTSLSNNHQQVIAAINSSSPSYTALNLSSALELAYHAINWSDAQVGDVTYIGGNRVARFDDIAASVPHLHVIPIPVNPDNLGILRLSVRQDLEGKDLWSASVTVRNYGRTPRPVTLRAQFALSTFAPRRFQLAPGDERTEEFKFSTTGSGLLKASLDGQDALRLDDEASLQLPESGRLRAAVITDRASSWQPLLDSNSRIQASYFGTSAYKPKPDADVILLDGYAPAKPPLVPSLWVMPPPQQSPVRVVATESDVPLTHWYTEHEAGAGLRSKELPLAKVEVFAQENDVAPVAGSNHGPVVVTRAGKGEQTRIAVVGFDPLQGAVRFEVSTPLLFANLLRWLEPDRFRETELMAAAVGTASVPLQSGEGEAQFHVTDDKNWNVPFTVRGDSLQLYSSTPGVIRVVSPERERILSLTLPSVGEFEWKPPRNATEPPSAGWGGPNAIDLWKWLAILGALGLAAEWLVFGRQRRARELVTSTGSSSSDGKRDRHLVHQ